MAVTCDYANPDDLLVVNYHFDADSMTIYPIDHPAVVEFLANGGVIAPYATPEAPPAPPPHLNSGGLARFTGTLPVTMSADSIRMAGVSRVAKGRYRATHEEAMPSDQYSVLPSVFDANPRLIRVTARTASYVEVRVTDLSGVAQDATEITIKTERVITP